MKIVPTACPRMLNDVTPGSLIVVEDRGQFWCLRCGQGGRSDTFFVVHLGPQFPRDIDVPFLRELPGNQRTIDFGCEFVVSFAADASQLSLAVPDYSTPAAGLVLAADQVFIRIGPFHNISSMYYINVESGKICDPPEGPSAFAEGWRFAIPNLLESNGFQEVVRFRCPTV